MLEKILKQTKSVQKAIKVVVTIIIILFVLAIIYGVYNLFTREPQPEVLIQKEEELKNSDIPLNQKVIDKLDERKENGLPLDLSRLGRDNPFLNF